MNEPKLLRIGTRGPRGKGMKRSISGVGVGVKAQGHRTPKSLAEASFLILQHQHLQTILENLSFQQLVLFRHLHVFCFLKFRHHTRFRDSSV